MTQGTELHLQHGCHIVQCVWQHTQLNYSAGVKQIVLQLLSVLSMWPLPVKQCLRHVWLKTIWHQCGWIITAFQYHRSHSLVILNTVIFPVHDPKTTTRNKINSFLSTRSVKTGLWLHTWKCVGAQTAAQAVVRRSWSRINVVWKWQGQHPRAFCCPHLKNNMYSGNHNQQHKTHR